MRTQVIGNLVPLATLMIAVATQVNAGTTGQLGGFVSDVSGKPIPGVTVTASSPAQIGAEQITTSESDGSFRFPRLTPGYYTVLFEEAGYSPQQLEQVQIRLDRATKIQVSLQQTSFSGEIEVLETTPVVDPAQVSTGQSYTSEYMTETRTDWAELITQTAGASQNFRRVMGSTPQDGGYMLDGMDSTNWYQRHPNLAAFNLPFDAIQEVAVHTAGFEAEFGQATGAVVNVLTKSGGNRFTGTVDGRYTGSGLETSGEHYDPNEQESENARLAATFGGPILKDRLWFFASFGRTLIKYTPTGAPSTFNATEDIFLGKLTWQLADSWSLVGRYSYSPIVEENVGASHTTEPDATGKFDRRPMISSIEAFGVLSDNLIWSLHLSREDWPETGLSQNGNLQTIGHYNLVTGEDTDNWRSQWYADSEQEAIATDLTWFIDAAGAHEVKAGLGYGTPWYLDDYCLNGPGGRCAPGVEGFFFRDVVDPNGDPTPYFMNVSPAEGPLYYGGSYFNAFVQDAWRILPNLNLKLGLRYDRVRYDNEIAEIADLSKFQPRAGIAWDLTSDGRTILRGSWGRFMHPGTALLPSSTNRTNYPTEVWLSCSSFVSTDPGVCSDYANAEGLGYRGDPENWDPAGWLLDPSYVFSSEPAQTADDLRAGYADHWIISLERELTRRTAIELSYVNKTSFDMFDDTCNGNIPDPVQGSPCDFYVVTNLPEIKFDYEALMLRFESNAWDNLHLLASWVVSESKGSINANTGQTGAFDVYPYHFENRYGYLADHSRHRVKVNGYWLLPLGFSLAFDGWWESESRWTVYDQTIPGMPYGAQYLEPRGSRRTGSLHQVNLQAAKTFRVGPTRLVLLASVLNLTDSQSATNICGSVTGCGGVGFGEAQGWQQPRRYELGLRVEF